MEKLQGSSIMVSSPPSSSTTSPSHEFSFTVSLHNSSSSSNIVLDNKSKTPPSSIAIDLTPADDIFFHGHLLPLHLLSHLSVSPRSSTNSLDSFTLPIKELLENDPSLPNPEKTSKSIEATQATSSTSSTTRQQKKSKSFSLFSFTRRQKARVLEVVEGNKDQKKHDKRRVRFDISHVLKRYVNMVRPLLFFKGKREKLHNIHRQAYSFSGNLRNKNEEFTKGIRRGSEYSSAPASMRTSPTNSGLLVATTPFHSSTSDSTMEELQAAIQAAIAHCKNSIRGEEKLKC